MMPVRSEVRSNSRKLGMFQFRDEHGGDAVERGAALGLDGLERGQRVELGAGRTSASRCTRHISDAITQPKQ